MRRWRPGFPLRGCEYTAFWTRTESYPGDPQFPGVMETPPYTMTTAVTATLTYTEVTWNAEDRLLSTTVESLETGVIHAITATDGGAGG